MGGVRCKCLHSLRDVPPRCLAPLLLKARARSRSEDLTAPPSPERPTMQASLFSSADSLSTYLADISQYPLLTQPEEQTLARAFRQGDLSAGHRLVTSNLRFVVKVSYEYRSYGIKMSDL